MDIDIVLLWVDGNDAQWQSRFNAFAPKQKQIDIDTSAERYRDWDCLRYWFRGIERFAPWVRTVHLVTDNQVPGWINKDCPKLHLVNHEDFIEKEYLPTFNACAIETNIHRIDGLAEHFIFFNDDFFFTAPVSKERFFRHGLPTDMAVLNTLQSEGLMGHITLNDTDIINHHFSKRTVMKHVGQWFNLRYSTFLFRTLALLPWPRFSGFYDHHLPQPFCKHTLEEVWAAEKEVMQETSCHRFRHIEDCNQWLFRYWHLCTGEFTPMNVTRDSEVYYLQDANFDKAIEAIRCPKKRIIVLNDGPVSDFEEKKKQMQAAFETLLPDKSIFEK